MRWISLTLWKITIYTRVYLWLIPTCLGPRRSITNHHLSVVINMKKQIWLGDFPEVKGLQGLTPGCYTEINSKTEDRVPYGPNEPVTKMSMWTWVSEGFRERNENGRSLSPRSESREWTSMESRCDGHSCIMSLETCDTQNVIDTSKRNPCWNWIRGRHGPGEDNHSGDQVHPLVYIEKFNSFSWENMWCYKPCSLFTLLWWGHTEDIQRNTQ